MVWVLSRGPAACARSQRTRLHQGGEHKETRYRRGCMSHRRLLALTTWFNSLGPITKQLKEAETMY